MNNKASANYAVGLMAIIVGIFRLVDDWGRPDGKWAMLLGPVYDVTGDVGFSALTFLLGFAFLYVGYINRIVK